MKTKHFNEDPVERFIEWTTQFWWPLAAISAMAFILYQFLV